MDKELLNEFIIERYGRGNNIIYTVVPTDKAYELLNLDSKIELIGKHGYPKDTISYKYYRMTLLYFLIRQQYKQL